MIEKIITYCGQLAKVNCDENCNKAWGNNSRPKYYFDEENDPDDYFEYADFELGIAPADPGTYEGGHAKPTNDSEKMNKWCVRECERCAMSDIGKHNEPLKIIDYNNRFYNAPYKHEELKVKQ